MLYQICQIVFGCDKSPSKSPIKNSRSARPEILVTKTPSDASRSLCKDSCSGGQCLIGPSSSRIFPSSHEATMDRVGRFLARFQTNDTDDDNNGGGGVGDDAMLCAHCLLSPMLFAVGHILFNDST